MDRKITKVLVFLSAFFFASTVFGFQVQVDVANVSCNGANNGSATAIIIDGAGDTYSYSWSNNQTGQSISSLAPGNYQVTATNQSGVTATKSFYISEPAAITLTVLASYETCDISHDGTASVLAFGGTPPYNVQWSGPDGPIPAQISAPPYWLVKGLRQGTYSVTITDANGCTATGSAVVELSPEGIWLGTTPYDASCANDCDGSANVMPMTGKAPYTYLWSNGETTQVVIGLCPNDYSVTVTDKNGCSAIDNTTINGPTPIVSNISSSPSGCIGTNSGSASVSPAGGTPGYTYLWSTGATTSTIMGLAPNSYSVTITDSKGCTSVSTVTVGSQSSSNLDYTLTGLDASCSGNCDGSATVNIVTGTAPYTYNWSNGGSTSSISGLCATSYAVTVTDADGCPIVKMVTIGQPSAINLTSSVVDANCGSSDGKATVNATGGSGSYTYSWSNNQTNSTATNLAAGTYIVTVTDGNGCIATLSVFVGSTGSNMTASVSSAPTTCSDSNDGQASVTVSGGSTPYAFAWDNSSTGATVNNLTAGSHTVTITDANGCIMVQSVTISAPAAIVISSTTNPASCGSANGSASATVTGGTGTISYLWSNGETTVSIANVTAGNYTLTIADGNLCFASASVVIGQTGGNVVATASSTDVTCNGGSNGSSTITVTTGDAPFTYNWDDNSTDATNSNLSAGTHGWMVTDASGCVATGSVTIGEPTAMELTFSDIVDASCGNDNGSAIVNVTGGTAPYTYQWNDAFGITTNHLMSVPAGTYLVVVTDANDCVTTSSVTIGTTEGFTCNASIASSYNGAHISSIGGNDGSATVTTNGGNSFSYLWSNGATSQQVTGLSAGTYTVVVTDAVTGCTCESSVTLEDPAKLGNFVWLDVNGNGLQDAGENGIEGVSVNVTGTSAYGGAIDMTMTTDATGMYMFTLPPGDYKVTFTAPENHDFTLLNAGDDALDSDADDSTNGMTQVVTIGSGEYYPDLDAGFMKNCVSIGNFVWVDKDQNGLQAPSESGIGGIVVNLLSGGSVVETTTTNADGSYLFDCVAPGTYKIMFSNLPDGYEFTTQDESNNDGIDSDANANGMTDEFTVVLTNGDDLNFDAGIHTNCDNVHFPGTVGYDQDICAGDTPAEFVTITEAIGGTGDFEYIWMKKNLSSGEQWTAIPGSTNPTYQAPPVSETTLYRKCVRRAGCSSYLEPPAITVSVVACGAGFVNLSGSAVSTGEVSLEWVTGAEAGEYTYQVEHSANGSDFVSMDVMIGHGISNGYNYYSYMDKHPRAGTNYYRVIMNGPNGYEMTSDVIKVMMNHNGEELDIFPNPANDIFFVDIMKDVETGTVELLDANGKVLKTYSVKAGASGPRPFLIDNLSSGLYFVKVTIDGDVKMMKLRKE